MPTISVELPNDRSRLGTLSLLADDGTIVAGPFPAYGKADRGTATGHGNANGSSLLPYGDTPAGNYNVSGLEATGDGTTRSQHSYGPNGAIRLNPVSGDALTASTLGRQYLLIHGGDPNPAGGLRPTNGCIRLADVDMLALLNAIAVEEQLTGVPPDSCSVQSTAVSVVSGGLDDGYDEGDPPPNTVPIPYPPPPAPIP